jgi:protein-tyrosine phosphatase
MARMLVVCTGNVCRSPIAEGVLRSLFEGRLGGRAPAVESAGTAGWEGSRADPGSVRAAADLGVDISGHLGRRLTERLLEESALVIAMAAEHRDLVRRRVPDVRDRTFTLKELVRLLEALPSPSSDRDPQDTLALRVAEADALRRSGFEGNRWDEDVVDPLGMPLEVFQAVAIEIEAWSERLADAMFGPVTTPAQAEGA